MRVRLMTLDDMARLPVTGTIPPASPNVAECVFPPAQAASCTLCEPGRCQASRPRAVDPRLGPYSRSNEKDVNSSFSYNLCLQPSVQHRTRLLGSIVRQGSPISAAPGDAPGLCRGSDKQPA